MDRAFGQPFTIRLHIFSAILTFSLLAWHFLVRIDWYEIGTLSTLLGLNSGFLLVSLMLLASSKWVKTPLSIGKKGNYNRLRLLHNTMPPLCVVLWVHVVISEAHESNPVGTGIVTAYLITVLAIYLNHKKQSSPGRGIQGHIQDIVRYKDAQIINLKIGQLNRPFQFQNGQYGYMRILGSDMPAEEHPFSFSSRVSSGENFQVSIKAVGDYTEQLYRQCTVGTPVSISGPYGRFIFKPGSSRRNLFIAGGVGITPFLSIIDGLIDQGLQESVHLLWLCSKETDFFARSIIEQAMEKLQLFEAEFIIDRWGENISTDSFRSLSSHSESCELYTCAPPPLMKKVIRCAKMAGIRSRQIHHEAFSF